MGSLNKNTMIEQLSQEFPPIFCTETVPQLLQGIYKYQTLYNMKSERDGPPSTKIGKKICYERESVLQ